MTIEDDSRLSQARPQKDNDTWLVVMDVENIIIPIINTGLYLSFKRLDKWIHEKFPHSEKAAYLDVQRANGTRNTLHRLGWTINDINTREEDDKKTPTIIRNAIDLNLALDTQEAAFYKNPKGILLLGGDGDYIPLVKKLKGHGTSVVVAAAESSFSLGLRRLADEFYYLDELAVPRIRKKEKNPVKQQDENGLLDQTTVSKIRKNMIKKLEERGGSLPVPQGLKSIYMNTSATSLRDLGIKKSKDLKLKFPELFNGIEIQGNLLTMEDSK